MTLFYDASGMATPDDFCEVPMSSWAVIDAARCGDGDFTNGEIINAELSKGEEGLADYRRDEEAFGFAYELSLV